MAAAYRAEQTNGVVHLRDADSDTVVRLLPSCGNVTFEMRVKGHNILWFPYKTVEEFRRWDTRNMVGIPFLGPWANRLSEHAFYANGQRYAFDMGIGNIRDDERVGLPIHGFLTATDRWRIVELKADTHAAWVTSRLEFFRQPAWMKQFPFAHTIQITHRLAEGVLQVSTRIDNLSADPMPVAIGFHPYLTLTDASYRLQTIAIAAKTRWLLSPAKVPTGETEPIEKLFSNRRFIPLLRYELDDVFSDLDRDDSGRATMSVWGRRQRIDIVFGPNFRAAVVYTCPMPGFVCFEPMAGITDSMNLAQRGLYHELQSIEPGGAWEESFWVRASGFGVHGGME